MSTHILSQNPAKRQCLPLISKYYMVAKKLAKQSSIVIFPAKEVLTVTDPTLYSYGFLIFCMNETILSSGDLQCSASTAARTSRISTKGSCLQFCISCITSHFLFFPETGLIMLINGKIFQRNNNRHSATQFAFLTLQNTSIKISRAADSVGCFHCTFGRPDTYTFCNRPCLYRENDLPGRWLMGHTGAAAPPDA